MNITNTVTIFKTHHATNRHGMESSPIVNLTSFRCLFFAISIKLGLRLHKCKYTVPCRLCSPWLISTFSKGHFVPHSSPNDCPKNNKKVWNSPENLYRCPAFIDSFQEFYCDTRNILATSRKPIPNFHALPQRLQ